MDQSTIALLTTIAAAIAAIGSVTAAYANWRALSHAQQTTVMQANVADADMALRLLAAQEAINSKLLLARDAGYDVWAAAVRDWLNYLEALCCFMLRDALQPGCRALIYPTVVEGLQRVRETPELLEILEEAVSGPNALENIRLFVEREKDNLPRLAQTLTEIADEETDAGNQNG